MDWIQIKTESDLNEIIRLSESTAVLLFKHSTRCSISSMALSRLEREWDENNQIPVYFLDLLLYRDISNKIAVLFQVQHQSPQAILVRKGKAIYHASHSEIRCSEIITLLAD